MQYLYEILDFHLMIKWIIILKPFGWANEFCIREDDEFWGGQRKNAMG